MDHRQYIEQYLSADADGELSPAERQAVAVHLSGCSDCRQRLADERALKTLLRQRIPIVSAPPELRQNIIAKLDQEDASNQARGPHFSRRPLWMASLGALAAAAIIVVLILVGGLGRQPSQNSLEAAANDYQNAERRFESDSALRSQADLAQALTTAFGYPFIWDFSSLGLDLAGARIDHRPDGRVVAYSLYKGKLGSVLCINLRQTEFTFPPGGKEVHGVRFYQHKDLWIGVVNYGSVFCYFVSRLTPAQMLPALIRSGSNLGT